MILKRYYFSHIIILFFSLLLGTSVSAHFDASDPNFCRNGEKIRISRTDLTGGLLSKLIKEVNVDCPVGITDKENSLTRYIGRILVNNNRHMKSHDIFDQPRSAQQAYSYANCICASMINSEIDPDNIRPLFEGPEELLSEDHHDEYELGLGLSFSCYICK